MTGGWGPFAVNIDASERKARSRCLRLAIKLLTGPRGREAAFKLLVAETAPGDDEALREAEAEFEKLAPLDQRRVLASFGNIETTLKRSA